MPERVPVMHVPEYHRRIGLVVPRIASGYPPTMKIASHFAPNVALAEAVLAAMPDPGGDAAHDLSHVLRVWRNVQAISSVEGGDGTVLAAATLLHDCVALPKDAPDRARASSLSAERARRVLSGLDHPKTMVDAVTHAIEAHSFSAGIEPTTLEARILQDADRLDALGHIGIARCFFISGRLDRPLYDPEDPRAEMRPLDDRRFAADHFGTKLLTLAGAFKTKTGKAHAAKRHEIVCAFLEGFMAEVSGRPL